MTSIPCKTKKKSVDLHYDEQWEGYSRDDVLKRVHNLSPVLDAIVTPLKLSPGSRVLDLGCGPGILPLKICQSFGYAENIHVYGIDISDQALRLGRGVFESTDSHHQIQLMTSDCEVLPFKNSIFDAVISNAAINLLPDKKKGFMEIARVAKKEATVVMGDCTARENRRCRQKDSGRLWSACIAGAPTRNEFERLAGNSGLEIADVKDMTSEVSKLVNCGLWDWPEFVEYEMGYHIFVMRKI